MVAIISGALQHPNFYVPIYNKINSGVSIAVQITAHADAADYEIV